MILAFVFIVRRLNRFCPVTKKIFFFRLLKKFDFFQNFRVSSEFAQ